jgi:hypothetical protein
MANWKQEIDFTDLMDDFEVTEDAKAFAKRASTRILLFIENYQSWSDRIGVTEDLEQIAEGLSDADDKEEIDYLLADLYDLADNARIWVKTF